MLCTQPAWETAEQHALCQQWTEGVGLGREPAAPAATSQRSAGWLMADSQPASLVPDCTDAVLKLWQGRPDQVQTLGQGLHANLPASHTCSQQCSMAGGRGRRYSGTVQTSPANGRPSTSGHGWVP